MPASRWRSLGDRPATWLTLAVACFVAVWFSVVPSDSSVTSDDGAYALHVRALDLGSWSVPHAVATADPEGLAYPYQNARMSEKGFFPAPRHAVWIKVLHSAWDVGGIAGMRAMPAIGLAVAVAAAAAMGGIVHGRAGRLMAGVLTLTSPLLFHALQLWAHAAVAGAVATAMLAALHLMSGRSRTSPLWLAVGAVAAAAAASWRADGAVFGVAIAAVVGLVGLRVRRGSVMASAAVLGAATVAAYLLAGRYAEEIVGGSSEVGTGTSRASGDLVGRIRGAIHTFLSTAVSVESLVLLVVAVIVTGYAVAQLRRGRAGDAFALFSIAAIAWVVRMVLFPREMASGLLGAWPILLIGLVRPRSALRPAEWQLLGMVGIASLGIAALQYDEGGGLNWGGRFLAAAIPALAVWGAGALVHLVGSRELQRTIPAIAALVGASLVASLVFDSAVRARNQDAVEVTAELRVPVVTSSVPLPRLAWSTYPEVQWLHVPDEEGSGAEVPELLRLLDDAGIERIALYGVSGEVFRAVTGAPAAERPQRPVVVEVPDR